MTGHARRRVPLLAAALTLGATALGSAQATMPGVDEFAEALVALTARRWEGPRVEPPVEAPRPPGTVLLARSELHPVAVHGPPDVPPARADATLRHLEGAYEGLREAGWPAPPSDGGRGGTASFDLYLVPTPDDDVAALADAPVAWSPLDSVSAFAVVPEALPAGALAPCVTAAYAEAVLLALDPAEAPAWRKATAAYLTGQLAPGSGCVDGRGTQRHEPWRSWVSGAAADGGGGALLLERLDARLGARPGRFVRDLWDLARQRTWEGQAAGLRGAPDLWMALAAVLERSGGDLTETMEELAVRRYTDAPADGAVVPAWAPRWEDLPRRSRPFAPPLEPYGSAYARVDVRAAPPGSRLEVWLEGEFGVAWSLVAVRFDAEGREVGRMSAPARRGVPRSFLPVELGEGTASVLVVATNLSSRLPDADTPDVNARSLVIALAPGTE